MPGRPRRYAAADEQTVVRWIDGFDAEAAHQTGPVLDPRTWLPRDLPADGYRPVCDVDQWVFTPVTSTAAEDQGVERCVRRADMDGVLTLNRVIVVSLLAVAAFGLWRVALPAERKASDTVADAAVELLDTRTSARFVVAQSNLQTQLASTGSYAGATMPEGAVLVRADSGAYCVQVGPPGTVWHLAGPGGSALTGAC